MEGGPMTQRRFNPDLPSIAFNYFLANRQSNAVSRVFLASIQTLKNDENQVLVFRRNPNAVIGYRKLPHSALRFCGDPDGRRFLGAKFESVTNQVLEELQHLRSVGGYDWKVVARNDCRALLNRGLQ